jgi:hypothetical protein
MFWKSKQQKGKEGSEVKVPVVTIPKEFYGGANPVIKFRNVERNVEERKPQAAASTKTTPAPLPQKPLQPKPIPVTVAPQKTAVGLFSNRKTLFFGSLGIFLLFVGGASIFYWIQLRPKPTTNPPKQVVNTPPVITEQPPETNPVVVEVPSSTVVEIPSSTVPAADNPAPSSTISLAGGALEFPSILLGSGTDLDNDGLTDAEEELYGTDPAKPDTDGDGYDDSTEVYNLYAPTVPAPARLITTKTIEEFTNPKFNYQLYYPSTWAKGNVDQDYRDMLFSTITGENIEIRVFDREQNQSFDDWFGKWAPDQSLGSLKDFKTVFKGAGRSRNDNLVYYFEDDRSIYVILYHVTNSSVVNYREVMSMIARSFRIPGMSSAALPEQEVLGTQTP